jgi:WD40 repeat protein
LYPQEENTEWDSDISYEVTAVVSHGDYLFVGGGIETTWRGFTMWNSSGKCIHSHQTEGRVRSMAVFNNELIVALAIRPGNLVVFDLTSPTFQQKKITTKLKSHSLPVNGLFVWNKENLWFSASADLTLVCNVQHQIFKVLEEHDSWVTCVTVWNDRWLVTGSLDKTVKLWDPQQSWNCIHTITMDNKVQSLACWNNHIIGGMDDGSVAILDASTQKVIKTVKPHSEEVKSLLVHNGFLYCASDDKTVSVLDSEYNCAATWKEHQNAVCCLCVYQNNIVSGSWDKTVRIWKPHRQGMSYSWLFCQMRF